MARDLAHNSPLMWKSRSEVLNTLGQPDVELHAGQTLRYRVDIGFRWIYQPQLYDLVVRFGKGDDVFQVVLEPAADW